MEQWRGDTDEWGKHVNCSEMRCESTTRRMGTAKKPATNISIAASAILLYYYIDFVVVDHCRVANSSVEKEPHREREIDWNDEKSTIANKFTLFFAQIDDFTELPCLCIHRIYWCSWFCSMAFITLSWKIDRHGGDGLLDLCRVLGMQFRAAGFPGSCGNKQSVKRT